MANDADAVEPAVNASTTVPSPSVSDDENPADDKVSATGVDKMSGEDDKAEEPVEDAGDTPDRDGESATRGTDAAPGIRLALVVGLITLLALGGLAGWFGYGAVKDHRTDKMRTLFLAVGRQGALNLTTINYTDADAAVQRILDSSTGQFYDDFSKRSAAFVDVVKQAQAKTDGSVVEAGLESVTGDSARVLVAVLVTTSTKGTTDQQPRHWRMRIDVQKVGDTVKVANVGFVP